MNHIICVYASMLSYYIISHLVCEQIALTYLDVKLISRYVYTTK